MRRPLGRRPLGLFVLVLLVALCTTALGLLLGGEPAGDLGSAAPTSSLAKMEASLFLPTSDFCPDPAPSTGCTYEGQCCFCGCEGSGSCVTFRGRLICLCSCSL